LIVTPFLPRGFAMPHPDEQPYLDAIAANPNSDPARLEFADWLESQNDPRAGWVRDRELFRLLSLNAENPLQTFFEQMSVIWNGSLIDVAEEGEEIKNEEYERRFNEQNERFFRNLRRLGEPSIPFMLNFLGNGACWITANEDNRWFIYELKAFLLTYPETLLKHRQLIVNFSKFILPEAEILGISLLFELEQKYPLMTEDLIGVLKSKELVDGEPVLLKILDPMSITTALYSQFVAWTQPSLLRQFRQAEPDNAERLSHIGTILGTIGSQLIEHENTTGETKPELGTIIDLLSTGAGHIHPNMAVPCAIALERMEAISPETLKQFVQNSTLETCQRLLQENPKRDEKWLRNWLDMYAEKDLPEHARIAILGAISTANTEDTQPILKLYTQVLAGNNPALKLAVLEGLKSFQIHGAEILDLLRLLFKAPEKEVREELARILPELGLEEKVAFRCVKILVGDVEQEVRSQAASAALSFNVLDRLSEELTTDTQDENPEVRMKAYLGLGSLLLDDTEETIKTLLRGLRDDNVKVRKAAAEAIYLTIDGDYEPALRHFNRALKDDDATVRHFAILSMGTYHEEAYDFLDTLLEMRDDLSPLIRGAVHCVLAQIASDEKKIRRYVTNALRDPQEKVVSLTLRGIDLDDFDSPEVQETIAELMSHPRDSVRNAAFQTLFDLDVEQFQPETWKAFRKALLDPNPNFREHAFKLITEKEDQAPYVVKEMVQLLQNPGTLDVEELIEGIAGQTQAYAPLLDIFSHPKLSVRQAVFQTLQKLVQGKPAVAQPVAESLMLEFPDALASHRGKSLEYLLHLIATLGSSVSYLYPEVSRLMNHPCAQVRADAMYTLATFGDVAKPLIPKFKELNESGLLVERAATAGALLLLDAFETPQIVQDYLDTMDSGNLTYNRYMTRAIMAHPKPTAKMIEACFNQTTHYHFWYAPEFVEEAANFQVFGDKIRPFIPIILERFRNVENRECTERMLKSFLHFGPMLSPYFDQYLESLKSIITIQEPELYIKVLVATKHPDTVTALGKLLWHKFGVIRVAAAEALLEMGMAAKPILPTIIEAIRDPDWDNVEETKKEFESWQYEEEQDPDPDPDMDRSLTGYDERSTLIELVELMGPSARKAIPALVEVLEEDYENVRHAAIDALIAMGSIAYDALEEATGNEDDYVVHRAQAAIEELNDDEDEDDRPRRTRLRDDE